MNRWIWMIVALFTATAGCTDPGTYDGRDTETEKDAGADTFVDGGGDAVGDVGSDTVVDAADGTEVGDTLDGGDTVDARDTSPDSCGGCSGETPVCLAETGMCVECLTSEDCTGEEASVCNPETNTCVACLPKNKPDWYPDQDGDGFGDASASPTAACEQPDGMVENADDCDDTNPAVHPDADEICNGRDDDCDGKDDTADDVKASDCAKQKGVCQGATISTCSDDGSAYKTCTADQYGDEYREDNNEDWLCDGADNDCDGQVDEACCGMNATPTTVRVGDKILDQTNPAIVPAVSGAPSRARYLAVWSVGDELVLLHVDKKGVFVGNEVTGQFGFSNITDLAVVRANNGYTIAIANEQNRSSFVSLVSYDAGLNKSGQVFPVESKLRGTISGATVVGSGQNIWVTYSYQNSSNKHAIRAAKVDIQSNQVTSGPFAVSKSGNALPQPGAPEIAMVGGTPTVAWWDASAQKVRGARLSSSRVDNRFTISTQVVNLTASEPISLFAHNGEAHLVFPDYTNAGTSALQHFTVGANQTGTLTGGTAITGDSQTNHQPSARPIDTDGDGQNDHLLAVWARGSTSDPSLLVGQTSLGSPGNMAGRTMKKAGDELVEPSVVAGRQSAGSLYLLTNRRKNDVQFAPTSLAGIPMCF